MCLYVHPERRESLLPIGRVETSFFALQMTARVFLVSNAYPRLSRRVHFLSLSSVKISLSPYIYPSIYILSPYSCLSAYHLYVGYYNVSITRMASLTDSLGTNLSSVSSLFLLLSFFLSFHTHSFFLSSFSRNSDVLLCLSSKES